MEEKICNKCGKLLPLNEFYINRKNHDGHDTQCKDCKKEYNKSYRNNIKPLEELEQYTNRQILNELKRRGFKGELTQIVITKF